MKKDFYLEPNKYFISITVFASFLVALPIMSIFLNLFSSDQSLLNFFNFSTIKIYLKTTFLLLVGVGFFVLLLGVSTAWFVTMTNFPFVKFFEWSLLLPLAFPSYIVAFTYTDLLDYSGPIQTFLRSYFEWNSYNDYYFPNLRSLEGAIVMMSLVLYPYVYLLARTAFLEQSVNTLEISKNLGKNPIQSFFEVSLPFARPAIVLGLSLALMESLNDFGTVEFFAVPTLTQGIYDLWIGSGDYASGTRLASIMFIFVFILYFMERSGRAKIEIYQTVSTRLSKLPKYTLEGWKKYIVFILCLIPLVFGFLIPFIFLLYLSFIYFDNGFTSNFINALVNTFYLSFLSAIIICIVGVMVVYSRRVISLNKIVRFLINISSMGYAIPGAVLAVGIIIPINLFENSFDNLMQKVFDLNTGLFISGTIFILIFGYLVRFLIIPSGQIESSLKKIPPTVDMFSRSVGYSSLNVMKKFHFPLIKGALITSFLLVFVDCVKELPITLLLRPFNFETLSTNVYLFASDEMYGHASLGALTIVLIGIIPVIIMTKLISHSRSKYEHS